MKKTIAALLSGAMLMALPVPAFAIPPYDNLPEGMDQETYDRLNDGTAEWDEIGDLIRYYNPLYTSYMTEIDASMEDLESSIGTDFMEYKEQLSSVDKALESLYEGQKELEALPPGTPGKDEYLSYLKEQIDTAITGRAELIAGLDTLASKDAQLDGRLYVSGTSTGVRSREAMELQLYPILEQLQSAVEGLFISYEQLSISRDMLSEQVSLYEKLLATQQGLYAQGLCTKAEVNAASADLSSARGDLQQLEASMGQLAGAIGLQLGYKQSVPVIGKVPEPDISYLESADPSRDLQKAAGENSTVKDAGRSDGTTAGTESRDRRENEAMGKLSAKLSELYADMKEKKLLYDAAQATLQKAERTRASADRMYGLGMLSISEYQAQMLAYTSYRASAELAGLNLVQSINNYKWALNGVVSLD